MSTTGILNTETICEDCGLPVACQFDADVSPYSPDLCWMNWYADQTERMRREIGELRAKVSARDDVIRNLMQALTQ